MKNGSNLPPGCFSSDIPGNRPEDECREQVLDDFLDSLGDLANVIEPASMATDCKIEEVIERAIWYGMEVGRKESQECQKEDLHYMWIEIEDALDSAKVRIGTLIGH